MQTITINTAGKRNTAYVTNWKGTQVESKNKISVKKANEIIKHKEIFSETLNSVTYKL